MRLTLATVARLYWARVTAAAATVEATRSSNTLGTISSAVGSATGEASRELGNAFGFRDPVSQRQQPRSVVDDPERVRTNRASDKTKVVRCGQANLSS